MKILNTIKYDTKRNAGIIVLNRPHVHNAINGEMIKEIRDCLGIFSRINGLRLIFIKSENENFSSGADLNYMREQADKDKYENYEDALNLASLFREIHSFVLPVITFSSGIVAGGANGIIAASDISVADESTVFRFSEALLGLVPATIAPYVINRMGRNKTLELMITAAVFNAEEAGRFGLVNKILKRSAHEAFQDKLVETFNRLAPGAVKKTKRLFLELETLRPDENPDVITSGVIAEARASEEGKEGINAFFEKRKPNWIYEGL